MREIAEVDRDIELVQRRLKMDGESKRLQWQIKRALKTGGDLDQCKLDIGKLAEIVEQLETLK